MFNVGHTKNRGSIGYTHCCRNCEEIAHLRIVITRLKKRIDNLQQIAECEEFLNNIWLGLLSEVAEENGIGENTASVGSGESA